MRLFATCYYHISLCILYPYGVQTHCGITSILYRLICISMCTNANVLIHRLREHIPPMWATIHYTLLHSHQIVFFRLNNTRANGILLLLLLYIFAISWLCKVCLVSGFDSIVNSWIFLFVSFGSLFLVESIRVYACAEKVAYERIQMAANYSDLWAKAEHKKEKWSFHRVMCLIFGDTMNTNQSIILLIAFIE